MYTQRWKQRGLHGLLKAQLDPRIFRFHYVTGLRSVDLKICYRQSLRDLAKSQDLIYNLEDKFREQAIRGAFVPRGPLQLGLVEVLQRFSHPDLVKEFFKAQWRPASIRMLMHFGGRFPSYNINRNVVALGTSLFPLAKSISFVPCLVPPTVAKDGDKADDTRWTLSNMPAWLNAHSGNFVYLVWQEPDHG